MPRKKDDPFSQFGEAMKVAALEVALREETIQALLGFDPRWLDPQFRNQDESGYQLIESTYEALGDVLLSFQSQYKEIRPDWEPPKHCPCGWPGCEKDGDCEGSQS